MNTEENNGLELEELRRRCDLISAERDPQRLSELLDQLLTDLMPADKNFAVARRMLAPTLRND